MEDFFFDTIRNERDEDNEDANFKLQNTIENESNGEDEFLVTKDLDFFDEPPYSLKIGNKKVEKNEINLNNTYLITNYKSQRINETNSFSNVEKILETSAMKPGFEKQNTVPLEKSKKYLKMERKKQRKKTKGKEWFHMGTTELTKEVMTDLKLLKMRSVLDRKHVYKKNDMSKMPKYFQVGKVIESPADFYGGRIPKSQRKKSFVDELLADAEFQKYQRKKFKEIMDEKRRKKPKSGVRSNKKHKSKQKSKKKGEK